MFKFSLTENKIKKIHFIGIGGISMSGIAELLLNFGYEISGSDRKKTPKTIHLENLGIKVNYGQTKDNISDQELFIYTDAILPDNEELIAAKNTGRPCVTRGVFLGALMRNYEYSIAISGSHGKSTTTSIITKILVGSSEDPTILLGGDLDDIDGNVKVGKGKHLVTEACEYKGNILNYYPQLAVILNIDADHLDYYKNIDHIVATFIGYIKNLDENSKAIINIDDENTLKLIEHSKGEVITFAIDNPNSDYKVENISYTKQGYPTFDLKFKDGHFEHFELKIVGKYNIYNAVAAIVATYETGIDIETIKYGVNNYTPLHRRMEVLGTFCEATVMTDFAHHPTELKAVTQAISEYFDGRLVCVFQPHTYSRTKALLDDFAESFYNADEVIVTKIYAAREKFDPTIYSEDLVAKLVKNKVNAKYIETVEEVEEYLRKTCKKTDLILTVGCGDINEFGNTLAEKKF